jgi:hypothetical protein
MFSKGTTQAATSFKRFLHIGDEGFNERYLGLPIHLGRSKAEFGYLNEKVWRKNQMLAPEGLRLIQESGSLAGRCCGPNISQGIAFLMLLSRPIF